MVIPGVLSIITWAPFVGALLIMFTARHSPLAVRLIAAAVLLIAPTVLAFYSGGYFDGPRFVAALVAWSLVLVAAVVSPRPLPRSWPGPPAPPCSKS